MLYNNTAFPLPPWLQHHLSPYPLLQRWVTVSSIMSPRLKNIDIWRVRENEWEASITSIYISSKMSSNRHPVRDSSLLDNLPIKMFGRTARLIFVTQCSGTDAY
ncbi:hypothetical protein CEXT_245841 [Caerostris extrusa]|uniref:Uncharacterized protein n=1 Tax=Caerostris extrusa TaxID=172846 RepID=A0AAV4WFV8_CAEEX|nr:hypothetical protein CEXT_245841 [Caerostris extrusa]